MARSRRSAFDVPYAVTVPIATVAVLAGIYFFGATIRDAVGRFLHAEQVYSEYALVSRSALIDKLHADEAALQSIKYQSVLYESQAKRLDALRVELSEKPETAYGTARVLERPPHTHYDTLLINAGAADGVVVGDDVSAHNTTVGVVTSTSNGVSVVQLHSSPGATRDITLGTPTAIAVATGLGGGSFSVTVSGTVHVAVGDTLQDVRTSLPLAVIGSIEHKETDTSQTITAYAIVNFADMSDVSLTHRAQ